MPTFKELADLRLAKAADAKKLLETAEAANRDMTAEEKTAKSASLDAVFADILDQWAKAGLTK